MPPSDSSPGPTPERVSADPTVAYQPPPAAPAAPPPPVDRLGEYRILREVGRGLG